MRPKFSLLPLTAMLIVTVSAQMLGNHGEGTSSNQEQTREVDKIKSDLAELDSRIRELNRASQIPRVNPITKEVQNMRSDMKELRSRIQELERQPSLNLVAKHTRKLQKKSN